MNTLDSHLRRAAQLCALGALGAGFAPLAFSQVIAAAVAADKPPAQLADVVVKGQAQPAANSPYSSTTLDASQIRDAAINQPEQLLRKVPGVEVRGYHLGGVVNVITIRGFSGGAHGGDLGMVIDGIPLNEAMSHADGYADLNVIVPLEIESFQVYRGPVSALYGNFNRGGLIAIESRRGGRYAEIDASYGSFGTVDLQGAFGAKLGSGQFNGAAQAFHGGDYRPDSRYDRGTLSGRYTLGLTPESNLSVSGRAHQGRWTSASYLLRSQFEGGDPYGKDARVNDDGGDKHFYTGRVDYDQLLTPNLKLLAFGYLTQQDYARFFTRPLSAALWSQREENYRRDVGGTGFSLNGKGNLAGMPLNFVSGAEAYREKTDYQFYEGSLARQRTRPAAYDRRYEFNSVSAFGEVGAVPSPHFKPTLGLRYDRFTGDCKRNGSETGTDPCDRLNTVDRFTPKLGVRSTIAAGLDLRASFAEGFALPPDVSKYAAGGAGLKPTIYKQTELGFDYKSELWRADVAAYRLTSSNEVRSVSPGVYENFGRTRRTGVESTLAFTPWADVELGAGYGIANARVVENASAALVGNQVTGVPRRSASLTASYRPALGWGAAVEARKVGNSAVNAANTVFYGRYTTLDLSAQYVGQWGTTKYRAYAKVDNATDRVYASNAFVIGGQQLVAPAAPRTVQVGVQADF